jgi:hypothetical protein
VEPTRRRALINAGIAAGAALLIGFAIIAFSRGRENDRNISLTPPASLGPNSGSSPGTNKPTTPRAYLAWVPTGLPPGFAAGAAKLSYFDRVTVVLQDEIWLLRSTDDAGKTVKAPAPFAIPIDAAGIVPARFASFLPQPYRATVADLGPNEGILSETSAALRRIGVGGTLTFKGGTVKIVAVLPDVLVGAQELVVDASTGRSLGVHTSRYLLMHARDGASPTDAQLRPKLLRLLPAGMQYPAVQVRAPGETTYLRSADLVLPQEDIKARFGEWAGRPAPGNPGFLQIDPAWIQNNITTTTVPILGRVTCNKRLIPALRAAMEQLANEGDTGVVHDYEGCFVAKFLLNDPSASISHHAWGAAIDINAAESPYGAPPVQPPALVKVMQRQGFIYGGRFIIPDGAHFEYWRPRAKT